MGEVQRTGRSRVWTKLGLLPSSFVRDTRSHPFRHVALPPARDILPFCVLCLCWVSEVCALWGAGVGDEGHVVARAPSSEVCVWGITSRELGSRSVHTQRRRRHHLVVRLRISYIYYSH